MFKVGDLVVCTDDFEGRRDLTAKDVACFIAVKKITAFIDDWGLELNDGEHWVETYRFRQATPEEIESGHRIDNNMGDDSHIENHISPLCKMGVK